MIRKLLKPRDPGIVFFNGLVASILSVPLFIILYKYILGLTDALMFENKLLYGLLFIGVFVFLYLLVLCFRVVFYVLFFLALLSYTIASFLFDYGFAKLTADYQSFLYGIHTRIERMEFELRSDILTSKSEEIKKASDYDNHEVRNYAAHIAHKHFKEHATHKNFNVIHGFSIFKEVRNRWRYMSDPYQEDYYSPASETILQLKDDDFFKGDCDDYSILMGACLKNVGLRVRFVRTIVKEGEVEVGHIYPEVLVGNKKDFSEVVDLIQLCFRNEIRKKSVFYHLDSESNVWLNFDYNDFYPGGKYQSSVRVRVIEL